MKIRKPFYSILLSFLLLASCGTEETPETTVPDLPRESESDTAAGDVSAEEPENTETPGIIDTETEPEEITIVLGEETEPEEKKPAETEPSSSETLPGTHAEETLPEDTDDSTVRMLVPSSYGQVHDALIKSDWYGMSYEDALNAEIVETGAPMLEAEPVPDSVPDIPSSAPGMIYNEAEAPGKVYTAEEMYSKTNTQLADIDEGDIVKTDGEYIYVLKSESDFDELLILSAEGENSAVISRTVLTENAEYCGVPPVSGGTGSHITVRQTAHELYIENSRLSVIYSETQTGNGKSGVKTCADIYDISDPAEPAYLTTLGQDGYYTTSRMTDGTLWLITRMNLSIGSIAEPLDYESYIPGLFEKSFQTLIDPGCIVYPENPDEKNYTVITAVHPGSASRTDSKAFLGIAPDTVYMNSAGIIIADRIPYTEVSELRTEGVYTAADYRTGIRTKLIRFDITDGIRTSAYTELSGGLLNQFSMDEYDGYLRVVTTVEERSYTTYTDESWGFVNTVYHPEREGNTLYILDRNLNVTAVIEDIAPGERVKSVRFIGETGYFVTFRQTDPLFSVDLSDPLAPEIMGELKIPGFSEYLHPWSDGLLLGFGQNGNEDGQLDGHLRLSMFDTSDPYDVREYAKEILPFGYSEAETNHRAMLVSESRNLIGFPAENGYALYGYSSADGFFERAFVETDGEWNPRSRGLLVGDAVYILLEDGCTVLDADTFALLTSFGY